MTFKNTVNAAKWLGIVHVTNLIGALVLSVAVVRNSPKNDVSQYMYALFLAEAVSNYVLLQIQQKLVLVKNGDEFKKNIGHSLIVAAINIILLGCIAVLFLTNLDNLNGTISIVSFSGLIISSAVTFIARILYAIEDINMDYKSFASGNAWSIVASIFIAYGMYKFGAGVYSLIARELIRATMLLVFAMKYLPKNIFKESMFGDQIYDVKLFYSFVIKRHALKLIETTNYRVPALLLGGQSVDKLGDFAVPFQFGGQITQIFLIINDRLGYAFFSKYKSKSHSFIYIVSIINILAYGVLWILGEDLFYLLYGGNWESSRSELSYVFMYVLFHVEVILLTNYFTATEKFLPIYASWIMWPIAFFIINYVFIDWPISRYYAMASAVALFFSIIFFIREEFKK